jgi:hypothetical protein
MTPPNQLNLEFEFRIKALSGLTEFCLIDNDFLPNRFIYETARPGLVEIKAF